MTAKLVIQNLKKVYDGRAVVRDWQIDDFGHDRRLRTA
jgi:hypothetical protein